jgi:hypothetical protein
MTQLDRIEQRLQAIDDRTRSMEIAQAVVAADLATVKDTKNGDAGFFGGSTVKHVIAVLVAALAGAGGGHIPLPGGH